MYKGRILSPTPSSLNNVEIEDDNDYVLDPDQMYDILPQPYRSINKILTHILDSVWDIVGSKEISLFVEARKVQLPKLGDPQMLNLCNDATALASSTDGKYIFIGLPTGLVVLDASTQSLLQIWEQNRIEITSIKSYPIGLDCYVVITQDDMEQIRLFVFGFDTLFFVKAINENLPISNHENTSKILCQKWEASSCGHYAGFLFENTSSKEVWLEIYSFPVESWLQDFESIGAALRETNKSHQELAEDSESKVIELSTGKSNNLSGNLESGEKLDIKFSYPSAILKIKPPPEPRLTANASSNTALGKQKSETGDIIGLGLNHVLSVAHLDSLNAMFRYRHEDKIQYLPVDKEEKTVSATFHFVNAGMMGISSPDLNVADTVPVTVIVWWSDSPHICHYVLIKPGKGETENVEEAVSDDLEVKPEYVWPFTSNIICSSVSPCTTYLAVGLTNGNIVLWNRQLGLHKGVLTASDKNTVRSIRFLDPCLFSYEQPTYPPYPTTSATYLLVEYSDGVQNLLTTCDGSQQIPRCISEEPENAGDIQTLLQVIPNLPELMIYVKKNGNMYMKDIITGADVCQIVLPPTHQIQTPWSPMFAFGNEGNTLYIKGEGTEVDNAGTVSDISGIFMFDLRSYHVLDTYRIRKHMKKDLSVFTTQEQRINALLQERIQQQALRTFRLQKRWGQLKSEMNIIQQANKMSLKPGSPRKP